MSYWFERMEDVKGKKYPEQIAYLRENFGFSQTHANALVLYSRGSTTSRRFNTLDEYLAEFDAVKQETVRSIFATITKKYPKLELVIAWNHPMLKFGQHYIFGVSVLKHHILLAPMSKEVLEEFLPRLTEYVVNKKTFKIPVDWHVDKKLLLDMVGAELKFIAAK